MTGTCGSVAVILAAGKGTRMRSDEAKVLFPLYGRPVIDHVLDAVDAVDFERTLAVVGFCHRQVREALNGRGVEFVLQEPQLGTGHALQCAAPDLAGTKGAVAVLAGDAPLIQSATLARLLSRHHQTKATVTILTARMPDPSGYGRVVRNDHGSIVSIVEDKDCSAEEREIDEVNSSIYVFDYPFLARALPRLENQNQQGEYYLTDTVTMAFESGDRVEGVAVLDYREISGINTPEQLEQIEGWLKERDGE